MKTTSIADKQCCAFDVTSKCSVSAKGGAPQGNTNALKHGGTTAEAKAFRGEVRQVIKSHQVLLRNAVALLTD